MIRMIWRTASKRISGIFGTHYKREQGVTLVELMVALVIAGLIFAGVYQVYINSIRTNTLQEQIVDMQQNARVVMAQLMRELRLAGYDPTTLAAPAAITNAIMVNPSELDPNAANTYVLGMRADFDGDNDVEVVQYSIDYPDPTHPVLMRQVDNNVAEEFAYNIENLELTFYDADNCKMGDAASPCPYNNANVRRIHLKLTARTDLPDKDFSDPNFATDPDPVKKNYRRRIIEGDVILRNQALGIDSTAPACPIPIQATAAADCRVISVSWNKPDDLAGDLAGYNVYYSLGTIDTRTSSFSSFSDRGDDPGTLYEFDLLVPADGIWNIAVVSYDRSGNLCKKDEITTDVVTVTTGGNKQPSPPSAPKAVPDDNQVTVDWGKVTLNAIDNSTASDLAGYRLYRSFTDDSGTADLIADQFALPISKVVGGAPDNHTLLYVDNDVNTLTGGPVNCTLYYYWVSVIDACNLESDKSAVLSKKSDGSNTPGVTPPDNGSGMGAPSISKGIAGDDDLTIIIEWDPPSGDTTNLGGYEVHYGTTSGGPYNWINTDSNLNSPISVNNSTTSITINGLDKTLTYYFKVAALDSLCTLLNFSTEWPVSSNSCAPRLVQSPRTQSGGPYGGHYLFPGTAITGTPYANYATIGVNGTTGDQYVTWAPDPVDCEPESDNFGRVGFDVSTSGSPQVTFKIERENPDLSFTEYAADLLYFGIDSGLDVVSAPRNASGYYHYPTWPTALHLDTTKFCNVRHNFKVTADDGEGNLRTAVIPVTVDNGDIEIDGAAIVTSDINTANDYHNVVRFKIRNTNTVLDLNLNKITLDWGTATAFVQKLEVLEFDYPHAVIGEFSVKLEGRGAEIILTTVPTIMKAGTPGNKDQAYIQLTFTDNTESVISSVDMRGDTITINRLERQDKVEADLNTTNGTCNLVALGSAAVHQNPTISVAATVQDKPNLSTPPSKTPTDNIVSAGDEVTVTTEVTEESGFPLPTPTDGVKIYYYVDTAVLTTAPARPSNAGGGVGDYSLKITGTYDGIDTWSMVMPDLPDSQVWFYLEAMDGVDSDAFRNFDIYPETGAFGYVHCGSGPSITISKPGVNANGDQDVNTTITTGVPITTVTLTVVDDPLDSGVPQFTGTKDMCRGTNGNCASSTGGSSQAWTTSYLADDVGDKTVAHTLTITATDVCGNVTTLDKDINK